MDKKMGKKEKTQKQNTKTNKQKPTKQEKNNAPPPN